ncbi:MAG: LemA family protein [bacterium]|nr:LemA family protein [bacterium]MCP5066054.1 LemA family protein [bacterium]
MSWILIAAIIAVGIYAVSAYNKLVSLRNSSENAWSDIDVQLKRRYELIPNLVGTVKGYAQHEAGTFEKVTQARSQAMQATTPGEKGAAEGNLTHVLKSLFAVAEAYPELKANENFLALQSELSSIEDAIQNARRYYNAVVRDLNTGCDVFPSNVVANAFSIGKKEYFELDEESERVAPQVSFS